MRFRELVKECTRRFGKPRIRGSHHIFKVPGTRRILNIQPDKNGDAKRYQLAQCRAEFKRMDG